MPFDCVVLSTDLENNCWKQFPLVAEAWKKLFGVSVHLAIVSIGELSDEQKEVLAPAYGFVSHIRTGCSCKCQTYLASCLLASSLHASTRVLLSSLNFLPLGTKLINGRFSQIPANGLVVLGSEFHNSEPTPQGFMPYPIAAEARTLAHLFQTKPGEKWGSFCARFSEHESEKDLWRSVLRPETSVDRRLFFPASATLTVGCNPDLVDAAKLAAGDYTCASLPADSDHRQVARLLLAVTAPSSGTQTGTLDPQPSLLSSP